MSASSAMSAGAESLDAAAELLDPPDRDNVLGIEEALLHVGQHVGAACEDARARAELAEERQGLVERPGPVVIEDRQGEHGRSLRRVLRGRAIVARALL